MASLDTFLTRVIPRALGCADPVARQAIVDAAVEFCEETGVVQLVLDPFSLTAGVQNYALTLPAEHAVVSVRRGWYGTFPLTPAADDRITTSLAYSDDTGEDQATGAPVNYFWYDSEVWVYPVPTAQETKKLTLRVALKPTVDAATIPDELLNNWRDGIVSGALARVLGARGTVHYDPPEAGKYRGDFERAMNRARIAARSGRASGEMAVQPRPFA